MADYITTYSKLHFTPLDPDPEQISIRDIAHALSMMTRANGHFPQFYSVGQHSIQCAREAAARGWRRELVLACLLHDGSEAYLSDITRPVKKDLPGYRRIEAVLQDAIFQKFLGFVPQGEDADRIKEADDTCLYYEFLHFAGEEILENIPKAAAEADYRFRDFGEVEEEFLEFFARYCPEQEKKS